MPVGMYVSSIHLIPLAGSATVLHYLVNWKFHLFAFLNAISTVKNLRIVLTKSVGVEA